MEITITFIIIIIIADNNVTEVKLTAKYSHITNAGDSSDLATEQTKGVFLRLQIQRPDCSHGAADDKSGQFTLCSAVTQRCICLHQSLRTYQRHSTSSLLMSPSTSPHIIHLSTCGPTLDSTCSPLL
ncbi:uncharacterized protein V6R79_002520 [Siganus canaliculatus]